MLDQILIDLGIGGVSDVKSLNTRRKHARRSGIHAEVELEGRIFHLEDWSRGGFLFDPGQETRFRPGDHVSFVLRFFFPYEAIEVAHQGEIVRNVAERGGHFHIAVKFDTLTQQARREIDRVIDSYNTQEFLGSYAA